MRKMNGKTEMKQQWRYCCKMPAKSKFAVWVNGGVGFRSDSSALGLMRGMSLYPIYGLGDLGMNWYPRPKALPG
jgi:hypothetical protein